MAHGTGSKDIDNYFKGRDELPITSQSGTNRLNTVGSVSYGFDNNGNTIAEGAWQFVYNQNQRLVRVVDAGITKGEYIYNGNGQRVKKVVDGVTTVFHYDQGGQLIAESTSTGTVTAEYVYLNGNPLAKIEGSAVYYYHNDHLGIPQKMTDSSGAVVWQGEFKPFGEAVSVSGTITNNLRFPGQYFDIETGLLYNFARTYNPAIGRYIESDPLGIEEGENHLYVYVENNPIVNSDPWGLMGAKGDNPAGIPKIFVPPSKLPCGKTPDEYCSDSYRKKLLMCRGNGACMMRVREWLHQCVMWVNGLDVQPEKCPPQDCKK